MGKWLLSELINVSALQKMSEHLFIANGITVGICDYDGRFLVSCGWQDICTKFHRVHPVACKACRESDDFIKAHLNDNNYIEYKCLNNLWDIALPIIVLNEHVGTLFVGQFFYEDEEIDIEFFKKQAAEFGFNEEEYLEALNKVPRFSREKVHHIMEYYKGFVVMLADSSLSKLKHIKSEEKLYQNEIKVRNILEAMKDLVLVMDKEGKFIDYYNTSDVILYMTPADFIGKNYKECMPPKVSIIITETIEKLKKSDTVEPFDYSLEFANKIFWFSAQLSKIKGKDGVIDGYLAVIRDITDKKMYEEEILKAKSEAEAANNVKNIFIANISHELRTPINVILSALQLFELNLNKNFKTENQFENTYFKAMKQNCYRLLRITNNLIDITKIESGFMNLNLKSANIVSIVEDITLSVAEYAKSKDLFFQFDTEIEEKIIAIDPDKIERIILNLLSNAIKCTNKNGSIFVNIYDRDEKVVISIKDTGIGIPQDKVSNIFERFIQVEDTLIKRHEGSGIGLSIVKSFVEMHGGNIKVISELGAGSEFIIELPVNSIKETEIEECPINQNSENYVEMLNIEFSDIYM